MTSLRDCICRRPTPQKIPGVADLRCSACNNYVAPAHVTYGLFRSQVAPNTTVRNLYLDLAPTWNLPAPCTAYIGDKPVKPSYEMQSGETLTFKHSDRLSLHPLRTEELKRKLRGINSIAPDSNISMQNTEPNIPIPNGHLMGYVWGVRSFRPVYENTAELQYLQGMFRGRWYSPRQTARCKRARTSSRRAKQGEVPHDDGQRLCSCGINMYDLDNVSTVNEYDTAALVRGWGKVVVHSKGYRVEKAQIELIHNDNPTALNMILNLPGYKKRGTEGTTDWRLFTRTCNLMRTKMQEELIPIPKEEA